MFVNPLRMKSFCHQFEWVILISKGWLAIAKLKPLSLFISLLSMPMKAFDNVKINHHHTSGLSISDNLKSKPT